MKLLRRKSQPPPENAHGQRNIDGGYFSVWICPNGHGTIGDPAAPAKLACFTCLWNGTLEPDWRVATRDEARAYIYRLEGRAMHNGIGFRLL